MQKLTEFDLIFADEKFQENLTSFKSKCEQSNEFIVTSWITKALVTRNHSESMNWLALVSKFNVLFTQFKKTLSLL